jgi:tetratricopeptide (TPR) repeat protein
VSTYSLHNAARILKVAPSRLRYWKRTRLGVPRAGAPVSGSGAEGNADYDFRDLVGIKAVLSLIERGISLRRIRSSIEILRERLPEIEDPLTALRPWNEGSLRVVVEHDGCLMEPDGQLLLDMRSEGERAPAGVSAIAPPVEAGPADESLDESAGDFFERGCQLDADPETYTQAVEAYRVALELDPDFADAHCNVGALFYNRGQRSEARRHFERCLRLEPEHVEAHFNLANLLEEDGCNDMALHHYRTALATDAFNPDLHINLALLCEKLDLAAKAREHWKRYLQLEPNGSWSEMARLRLDAPTTS